MRFSTYLLTGLATVAGLAIASATIDKRSFRATCGHIDQNLVIKGRNFGHIESCTCLGGLPDFIKSNSVAKRAAQATSTRRVKDILYNVISAVTRGTCTYPEHSIPNCTGRCGYRCKAGYAKRDGHCVLSPSARAIKREEDVDKRCPFATTKCGIYDQTASRTGFECIDTKTSLESCGGCTIGFGSEPATGVDCTNIPGASDIECEKGVCVVNACKEGWSRVGTSGCEQT
ncbi:hypothetical protein BS47DRAFT_1341696 [Hydnum rufescens UP504]|uniref:Protein CPL1-like domain-containing protein n=1 Tax=Hydnum rufescens UP504 TaxID=1448309 RepID=A0A9P6DYA4_9AGAM|nr:hypothetical protein BS47DRAFT_1341696 [Hydnum rufescens UP504]